MVAWAFYKHISFFKISYSNLYFKHIDIYRDQVEIVLTFLFSKYFNTSILAQPTITRSNSAIATLEQGVKYVQS